MRKLYLLIIAVLCIISIITPTLSSAEPLALVTGSAVVSANNVADVIFFFGSFTGSEWMSIIAVWVLLGILINAWLVRYQLFQVTWVRIAYSVVGGYIILNNPFMLGLISNLTAIASIFILLVSVGLLSWLLPRFTISDKRQDELAKFNELRDLKREEKHESIEKKLNELETHLQEQQNALVEQEKKLETVESQEDLVVFEDIDKLIGCLQIAKKYEEMLEKAENMIAKLGYSSKTNDHFQKVIKNFKKYKKNLEKFETDAKTLLEKFKQDESQVEEDEEKELILAAQEEEEVEQEASDEEQENKVMEETIDEEKELSLNKRLPITDRTNLRVMESEERVELLAEERELALIQKKKGFEKRKKMMLREIRDVSDMIKDDTKSAEGKKGVEWEEIIEKIKNLKLKQVNLRHEVGLIDEEIEQANKQLKDITKEKKKLQDDFSRDIPA